MQAIIFCLHPPVHPPGHPPGHPPPDRLVAGLCLVSRTSDDKETSRNTRPTLCSIIRCKSLCLRILTFYDKSEVVLRKFIVLYSFPQAAGAGVTQYICEVFFIFKNST